MFVPLAPIDTQTDILSESQRFLKQIPDET